MGQFDLILNLKMAFKKQNVFFFVEVAIFFKRINSVSKAATDLCFSASLEIEPFHFQKLKPAAVLDCFEFFFSLPLDKKQIHQNPSWRKHNCCKTVGPHCQCY